PSPRPSPKAGTIQLEDGFSGGFGGLSCPEFNCIAVERWQPTFQLFDQFHPPLALLLILNSQLERGLALRSAPNGGPAEEAPAQGLQLHFLQQPQFALQQYAEVVSPNRQLTHRLGGRKLLAAKSFETELAAQFLDAIFTFRPPIVAPPHRQHTPTAR